MQLLATRAVQGGPLVLASFSGGPLALLRIMHPELMTVVKLTCPNLVHTIHMYNNNTTPVFPKGVGKTHETIFMFLGYFQQF